MGVISPASFAEMINLTKTTKVISYVLWLAAALAISVMFALSSHFAYTRPTVADPSNGRTYAHNYHGRVVYLNKTEAFELYTAEGVFVLSLLGFAAVVAKAVGPHNSQGR